MKAGGLAVHLQNLDSAYEAASHLCTHLMSAPLFKYDSAAAVIETVHTFVAKLRDKQTRFRDEG